MTRFLKRAFALLALVSMAQGAVAQIAYDPIANKNANAANNLAVKAGAAVAAITPAQRALWFPQRVQVRRVQSSPAAITYSTSGHTLTGTPLLAQSVQAQYPGYTSFTPNPLFRYRKASSVQLGAGGGSVSFGGANYGSASSANLVGIPILTDGGGVGVEFYVGDNGYSLTVKIDGEYYSLTGVTTGNTGAGGYVFVPLTDGFIHEVELIGPGNLKFIGLYYPSTATVMPAPARGASIIMLGDSGFEPTGASRAWNGIPQQFADTLGMDNVVPSAVGGTGILNPGTSPKMNWLSRIATDVCPFTPDYVWLPGFSINDSAYTPAQVAAQDQLVINAIRACSPKTQIVMSSAWTNKGGGFLNPNFYAMNSASKAVAAANGLIFVNILEPAYPANMTPQVLTLTNAITSTAGGSLIYTSASGLPLTGAYAFADGQHTILKDSNYVSAGVYQSHFDALYNTEPIGATLTQVVPSIITGGGNATSPQSNGNADRAIGTDQTHPTDAGHNLFGVALANGWLRAINANLKP